MTAEVLIPQGARQETVQHTDHRIPGAGVLHQEIHTGQVPAAVVPHRVIPGQRLLIAGPVITAAIPAQVLHIAVETGRAQVQAGLPIPLQEAAQVIRAHPGVAVIGLLLAAALQEAATGLLHPAVAVDHTAAEVVADHLHPPVAADRLPVVADPAVEEGNLRFILSHYRKINFGLVQVNYI